MSSLPRLKAVIPHREMTPIFVVLLLMLPLFFVLVFCINPTSDKSDTTQRRKSNRRGE